MSGVRARAGRPAPPRRTRRARPASGSDNNRAGERRHGEGRHDEKQGLLGDGQQREPGRAQQERRSIGRGRPAGGPRRQAGRQQQQDGVVGPAERVEDDHQDVPERQHAPLPVAIGGRVLGAPGRRHGDAEQRQGRGDGERARQRRRRDQRACELPADEEARGQAAEREGVVPEGLPGHGVGARFAERATQAAIPPSGSATRQIPPNTAANHQAARRSRRKTAGRSTSGVSLSAAAAAIQVAPRRRAPAPRRGARRRARFRGRATTARARGWSARGARARAKRRAAPDGTRGPLPRPAAPGARRESPGAPATAPARPRRRPVGERHQRQDGKQRGRRVHVVRPEELHRAGAERFGVGVGRRASSTGGQPRPA